MAKKKEKKEAMLNFLKRTKSGRYAKIDEKAISIPRYKELREEIYLSEDYYYGIR